MSIMDAARNLAENYPGGVAALAPRIEKNETTLRHELHETGTAKLGLRTAVQLTTRSKDLRILNAFAAECGAMVLLLPAALDVEDDATMRDLAALAREFADVVQEVTGAVADGAVTANELARVQAQWADLVGAGQRMLQHLQAAHQAARPAHLRAIGE